ncbi:MAG: 1-deoxy-D-xylulose-5-phosphate reductoisomerase [Lentisphaeria bacterium]|nr:1-deoxy-D-xylulose-5-phosphate reductoisomerase [Lentisphaeria bacterium]
MKKNIVLLGSTGSVGQNACKVLTFHQDRFAVKTVAANINYKMLFHQASQLHAPQAVIAHEAFAERAKAEAPSGIKVESGNEAIIDCVCADDTDIVICAILGNGALMPVLKALECGKTVALASKEVMLMAGRLIMDTAKKYGGRIIPVDSEHSAIFQCLAAHPRQDVKSLVLTCSGGPFRKYNAQQLQAAVVADALKHPVWSMGRKITIDSASLMNKALEVVEAEFLFEVPEKNIKVVIHPEGIIHSLVEFKDNSMVGLFSNPSMELPVQYALSYPDVFDSEVEPLDLAKISSLHFENVDNELFPSIDIAREALRTGKNMPLVMNAANDVAVKNFLEGRIKFTEIWDIVKICMERTPAAELNSIDEICAADSEVRMFAGEIIKSL